MFSLGYKWQASYTDVSYTYAKYLFTESDSCITYDTDEQYYNIHTSPEFTLEETVIYSLKETPKPIPVETIEIGGVLYAKADVENALKGLQAV